MKRVYKITILVVIIGLFTGNVHGQNLNITGRWDITSINYIIEPGSDINSVITSQSNQIELSITGNLNRSTWSLQISKVDVDWNSKIEIWIRRTGSGKGSGEVYAGTTFQKINNVPMSFLNGKKAVTKIPLQLEIRNLSVTIPAREYTTNIVYTLFEN